MIDLKPHTRIALAYFIMAALFGVLLRSFPLVEMPIIYKFFVHTHSHIALLGWVYLALTTLIYTLFIQSPTTDKKYRRIFWFTQFSLIGMLLTFPFTGYALFSIIFSTLFLFASYWFYGFFLKHTSSEIKKTKSYLCIKTALLYMVISSLGPWALGVIMNFLGAESIWYRLAIYFYLHFQYNGWMILALVGLFFFIMEQQQLKSSTKTFKRFFWTFNLGILLSSLLSTLFIDLPIILNILGGIGALFQLLGLVFLIIMFNKVKGMSSVAFSSFHKHLLRLIVGLLSTKMILQLLTATPYFADLAATILDFTIGYLHWTFLGVVSISLFLFVDYFKMLKIQKKAYSIYVMGFIVTEALIFYKGLAAWQGFNLFNGYFDVLAIGSFLIPLSLIFIFLGNLSNKNSGY